MKTTHTTVLACLAAVTLPCALADDHRERGRTEREGTRLPTFLQPYDLDNDGSINEEERQLMKEARAKGRLGGLSQWDIDKDGQVSPAEREAAQRLLRQRMHQKRLERFDRVDTDGDGQLSLEEFLAIPAVARLAEQSPERARQIFDHLDADDDGSVSPEEFTRTLERTRPTQTDGGGRRPGADQRR